MSKRSVTITIVAVVIVIIVIGIVVGIAAPSYSLPVAHVTGVETPVLVSVSEQWVQVKAVGGVSRVGRARLVTPPMNQSTSRGLVEVAGPNVPVGSSASLVLASLRENGASQNMLTNYVATVGLVGPVLSVAVADDVPSTGNVPDCMDVGMANAANVHAEALVVATNPMVSVDRPNESSVVVDVEGENVRTGPATGSLVWSTDPACVKVNVSGEGVALA